MGGDPQEGGERDGEMAVEDREEKEALNKGYKSWWPR